MTDNKSKVIQIENQFIFDVLGKPEGRSYSRLTEYLRTLSDADLLDIKKACQIQDKSVRRDVNALKLRAGFEISEHAMRGLEKARPKSFKKAIEYGYKFEPRIIKGHAFDGTPLTKVTYVSTHAEATRKAVTDDESEEYKLAKDMDTFEEIKLTHIGIMSKLDRAMGYAGDTAPMLRGVNAVLREREEAKLAEEVKRKGAQRKSVVDFGKALLKKLEEERQNQVKLKEQKDAEQAEQEKAVSTTP